MLRPDLAEGDDAIAASLKIEPSDGEVDIRRRGSELVISGSADAGQCLASNIGTLAYGPGQPGDHMHVEFFPGHYYLAPGSLPVVVEVSH